MKQFPPKSDGNSGYVRPVILWVGVLAIAVAALVYLFLSGASGNFLETASSTHSPDRSSENRKETKRSGSGSKLTFPETAKTQDVIMAEVIRPWLEENWQADGLAAADSAAIATELWVPFVDGAIRREIGSPDRPDGESLGILAEGLVADADKNPLSSYLVGRSLRNDHPDKVRLLERAARGFSSESGAEILAYHSGVEWTIAVLQSGGDGQNRAGNGNRLERNFRLVALSPEETIDWSFERLKAALATNEGFSGFHDRLAGYLLIGGYREVFFDAFHEPFLEAVQESEPADLWLKKWLEGKHFHKTAWEARGGGYSNSVSDDGWALYKRNMIKAKRSWEEAWEESPDHPGVAGDLVERALAENESGYKKEMEHWLTEAGKVQVDYDQVYTGALWGLRPRWHGSHREMIRFGEKCLDSGRFDSSVPWIYLQAHRDVSSEWDLPPAYFPKFRDYDALDTLFDGAENEDARSAWRSHDRTQAVIAYFMCRKYDKAKEWLDRVEGGDLHVGVLASWDGLEQDFIVGKINAFTGEYGETLMAAEKDEQRWSAASALETYDEVLQSAGESIPDLVKDFVEHRREIAFVESELKKKSKSVAFLPRESGAGWDLVNAKAGDGGRLEFSGEESEFFLATCEARVGASFSLKGKIENNGTLGEGARAWISFGYPEQDGERWGAVSFVWQDDSSGVQLSNAFNAPEEGNEIALGESAEFRLEVSVGGINFWVNEKLIWDNVPVPRNFVKEQHSRVGFGGIVSDEKSKIWFADVELSD